MNPLFGMFGGQTPQSIIGNNPQVAAMINMMKGGNPQAAMMNMMIGSNPQMQQIMQIAQSKNPQQLEALCRQKCQEQGIDFNQLVSEVKNMMK